MRVYQINKKVLGLAATMLLLICAVTGATQAQQVLAKPTVPPTPATLPAYQTAPAGFETLGFIEYASVDLMCDPAPPSTPLDTTPGAVATPTPVPSAPT